MIALLALAIGLLLPFTLSSGGFAEGGSADGFVITAKGDKGSRAALAFNATWRVHCAAP